MRFLVIVSLVLFLPYHVFAEENLSRIEGKIVDKSTKQPLGYVNVVIEGTTLGAAADTNGYFIVPRIPVGTYNVRFSLIGYQSIVKSNVDIRPRRSTYLFVELQETAIQSEGLVVTPSYFEKGKDAVASTRSLDFEDIRQDPGSAEDIQRAVQALPSVVSGSDQLNEIIVRGGGFGENLFVMDNIEIPNPNHFGIQGASGGPINVLNTYLVRQMDFYTGAFPARYGDKVSSVLDISLREGSAEKVQGNGYMGMAGAGILMEGPLNKGKGSWIISGRKSFLDLIISSTGLTSVPYYYNLQSKVVYQLSQRNKLIFNSLYGNDKIKIGSEDRRSGYKYEEDNVDSKGSQYSLGVSLRTLWNKHCFSDITLYQTENRWNHLVWEAAKSPKFRNNSREIIRDLKGEVVYRVSDTWELNGGFSIKNPLFRHNAWAQADTIFYWNINVVPPQPTGIFRTYPEWIDKNRVATYKKSSFFQTKNHFGRRFTSTIGLRYDSYDYTNHWYVSPRLGLSTAVTQKLSLNLAYGHLNQSPSFIELTAHQNNRYLKNKTTRQYVVGLEYLLAEDQKATLEIYDKKYTSVAVPLDWTTPDPFDNSQGEMVSTGKGYARGIEFFLQKKLSRSLQYTVSYAYSVAQALDERTNKYFNWDFDYRHVFTLIGGYRKKFAHSDWYERLKQQKFYKFTSWILPLADEVVLSLRWRYLGGRPYTHPIYYPYLQTWVTEVNLPLNGNRFPPYQRLDIRIDRRFYFNRWNLVTYFDIMNVFNRDNIWDNVYQKDGTIERVFQFKTFPVGGVAAEF